MKRTYQVVSSGSLCYQNPNRKKALAKAKRIVRPRGGTDRADVVEQPTKQVIRRFPRRP